MTAYKSELLSPDATLGHFQLLAKVANSRTHSMKAINACLLFCSVLCGVVGLGYLLFDPILKHVILDRLVLRNSSSTADIWENPPITPHLKVYFFNLTNPEAFFAGQQKPILKEVGPYTYHQKWIKENIDWHGNGTMTYQTRKQYKFMPELSVGHHATDLITTLNVPLVSAYHQMRSANFMTVWGFETIVYSLEYENWVTRTAEELVWGYPEPLFELVPNAPANEQFGFFAGGNDSYNVPRYTMFTGEGNPYNLSKISLFNGNQRLKFWKTDECNMVQGSDGASFNPYIQKDETLWIFNDQLCRSMPLVFKQEVQSGSLPGYRFVPREDVFMSSKSYPENSCFCVDETLCEMSKDGLFDVSRCQFNAPIMLSWPHLLGADEAVSSQVEGMNPSSEKHGFWFDIQPVTGTTLSAKARMQVNIALKKSTKLSSMSKINDTVVPVMWFEEGLDQLGKELMDVIGTAVVDPPVYKNYVLCTLFGLLSATLLISAIVLVRLGINKHRRRTFKQHALFNIRSILKHPHSAMSHCASYSATKPMLSQSSTDSPCESGFISVESSRLSTACHSRSTSAASSATFAEAEVENGAVEGLHLLLDDPQRTALDKV